MVATKALMRLVGRALEHLEAANHDRFVKIQEVAKEHAAGGGESDLRRLKRQFSSLKNTFMLYDVKDSFIDGAWPRLFAFDARSSTAVELDMLQA